MPKIGIVARSRVVREPRMGHQYLIDQSYGSIMALKQRLTLIPSDRISWNFITRLEIGSVAEDADTIHNSHGGRFVFVFPPIVATNIGVRLCRSRGCCLWTVQPRHCIRHFVRTTLSLVGVITGPHGSVRVLGTADCVFRSVVIVINA